MFREQNPLCVSTFIVAGLGENQDTVSKRINSWREAYIKGQPDIMIMNNHFRHNSLCIEFKSPNNNFKITGAQRVVKNRYKLNRYKLLFLNGYDKIISVLNNYMNEIRILCCYCSNQFLSNDTYQERIKGTEKASPIHTLFHR